MGSQNSPFQVNEYFKYVFGFWWSVALNLKTFLLKNSHASSNPWTLNLFLSFSGGRFCFSAAVWLFQICTFGQRQQRLRGATSREAERWSKEIFHFSKTLSLWPSWKEPSHRWTLFQHWRRMKWVLATENGILAGDGHDCCGCASQSRQSRQINFWKKHVWNKIILDECSTVVEIDHLRNR